MTTNESTTIAETHLNRSWSSMKAANQYCRRNGLNLTKAGYTIHEREIAKGTTVFEIVPVDQALAELDALDAADAAAQAAPAAKPDVLPQHKPGRRVAPAQAAVAAAALATPTVAWDRNTPMPARCIIELVTGDEDGHWAGDVAVVNAFKTAKRLKLMVRVRDAADPTRVVYETTGRKAKAPRAGGTGQPRNTDNERIILEQLRREGGATATEIRVALGWKAIAAEAYLTKFAAKRGLKLAIAKGATRAATRYSVPAAE